jgi:hypothetical protein
MCILSSELGSWKLGFPERSMDTFFKEFFRTQNSRFHFESPLELVAPRFLRTFPIIDRELYVSASCGNFA